MVLGIGLDLVSIDEVHEALRLHGRRYLDRVYSERERRESLEDPARLATRFAAKEATMKALGRDDEPIPWLSIALERDPSGLPQLALSGASAALAARRGVRGLRVSFSRTRGIVAAVVIAESAA